MWWIIAVAVVVLIGLIVIVFSLSLPKFKIIQKLIDRLNLVTRENLSGMMVIRAFNTQKFEEERFDKANHDLTGISLFVNRVMVVMMPLMMLIMNGLSLLIIWVGAHQVAQAQHAGRRHDGLHAVRHADRLLLPDDVVHVHHPAARLGLGRPHRRGAGDRADDPRPAEARSASAEPFKGAVEFRNVSFRYPGAEEDVLHDISFTAQPGQTTAFIGSTGSGKSTLVNLIPRFYDVTGGRDPGGRRRHPRRSPSTTCATRSAMSRRRASLFSGTIESNLRYADEDAGDGDAATRRPRSPRPASSSTTSPEGLAAEIAQGGANVSGGQKQRLSIARALVKQAADLHLRRQLLGAGLQDRRRPAPRAARSRPATAPC